MHERAHEYSLGDGEQRARGPTGRAEGTMRMRLLLSRSTRFGGIRQPLSLLFPPLSRSPSPASSSLSSVPGLSSMPRGRARGGERAQRRRVRVGRGALRLSFRRRNGSFFYCWPPLRASPFAFKLRPLPLSHPPSSNFRLSPFAFLSPPLPLPRSRPSALLRSLPSPT